MLVPIVRVPVVEQLQLPSNDKQEYMMLFYPLMQVGPRGSIGIRTICRLTCYDCFETLVDGMTVSAIDGNGDTFDISVLDAVEDQGSITWLERGIGQGCSAKTMSAFVLYSTVHGNLRVLGKLLKMNLHNNSNKQWLLVVVLSRFETHKTSHHDKLLMNTRNIGL